MNDEISNQYASASKPRPQFENIASSSARRTAAANLNWRLSTRRSALAASRVRGSFFKFTLDDAQCLEELRIRLRRVSDTQLQQFCKQQSTCAPRGSLPTFVARIIHGSTERRARRVETNLFLFASNRRQYAHESPA
jgi:hypothetical protein